MLLGGDGPNAVRGKRSLIMVVGAALEAVLIILRPAGLHL